MYLISPLFYLCIPFLVMPVWVLFVGMMRAMGNWGKDAKKTRDGILIVVISTIGLSVLLYITFFAMPMAVEQAVEQVL